MKLLKNTRSICAECFEEIEASVYERNNKIYMQKYCPKHGRSVIKIEDDAKFYTLVTNEKFNNSEVSPKALMLPFSHNCNLKCKMCYLPYNLEESTLKFFKNIIKKFSGDLICISGGEPTLRKDLAELIKYINSNNKKHFLITNGLLFKNEEYTKKLKSAGLNSVHFSLNALDRDVLRRMDGKDTLAHKLKGLENLKKSNIYISLSIVLVKGVNENQLEKFLKYYLKNPEFIAELRIRSGVQIGRYENVEPFGTSEIIRKVCNILGCSYKKVIKELAKKKDFCNIPCRVNMFLFFQKHRKGNFLLFSDMDEDIFYCLKSKRGKLLFSYKLITYGGIKNLLMYFKNKLIHEGEVIPIVVRMRSWPTKENIDLKDISYCRTRQLAEDGKIYPFCYAHLVNEKLAKLKKF